MQSVVLPIYNPYKWTCINLDLNNLSQLSEVIDN